MKLDPHTDLQLERAIHVPRDLMWECWITAEYNLQYLILVRIRCWPAMFN